MLKKGLILIMVAVGAMSTSAFADEGASSFTMNIVNSSNDINFNIAADLSGTATPNILSDLRWDDVEVWHLVGDIKYRFGDHFKVMGSVGFGVIVDGMATDRDFLGDFRTMEFSRATATVDGDHHVTASVGFGWEMRKQFSVPLWRMGDSNKRVAFASDIQFTPTIGYGYSKQEVKFTDGVLLIPDDGPFDGLNSSFDPKWSGAYVGFESKFSIAKNLYVNANFRYWSLNYSATAKWNLRSDLNQPESFVQDADADGFDSGIGIEWYIRDNKSIGLSYHESDFSTDPGSDKVITSQGQNLFTRLNKAEWLSRGWSLSFNWRF